MIEQRVFGTGKVVVVGHRGAMGYAPENTLPSFAEAAARGVHAIECDVHLTRDGEVVVIHDASVDRTSNGQGMVAEMTLAELKRLDFGVRFGDEYPGTRIPTLAEALDAARDLNLDIVVEIKGEPEPSLTLVQETVRLIGAHGMAARAAIISFHHPCLLWAKEQDASIPTGILFGHGTPDPVAEARTFGAISIRPHHSRVTPELVREAHEARLCLHAWTVDDDELARRLLDAGVDSLTGNYPDRLVSLLRRLGRLA